MPIYGEWSNPAEYRCNHKTAYRSLKRAADRARIATEKAGFLILAYECPDCGKFHIGHTDQTGWITFNQEPSQNNTFKRFHTKRAISAITRKIHTRIEKIKTGEYLFPDETVKNNFRKYTAHYKEYLAKEDRHFLNSL